MIDVAILGAGDIGGACALALAESDQVHRVTIIDPAGKTAAGKALDNISVLIRDIRAAIDRA